MITPSIGIKETKKQLETLLSLNIPVFIHGAPGIGKSYVVNELAKERGWEMSDIRLSQLDSVDLRGVPSIVDSKTVWMPPIFFPTSGSGILFLDELNSAAPNVQAAIYQLILDRKIGEYSLPAEWRIVCAGNRMSDKGIVFRLPSPLANRMAHIVSSANFTDFKEWAIKEGIHPFILGFLSFRPDLLSQEAPASTETNPAFATPRSWSMLSKILHGALKDNHINKLSPLVYGSIGYAVGAEFLAYTKVYESLPNVDAVFEGVDIEIPKEPSVLYALISALIERYDGSFERGAAILAFSKKLSLEFCVMLIKDAATKHEDITQIDGFDEWLEAYGKYLF